MVSRSLFLKNPYLLAIYTKVYTDEMVRYLGIASKYYKVLGVRESGRSIAETRLARD